MRVSVSRKITSAIAVIAFGAAVALIPASGAFASATISATSLNTGTNPTSAAYNPAGTVVAVANFGSPFYLIGSTVDLIDTATNTVRTITDDAIVSAQSLVWSPDGTTIYVLNYGGQGIAVIDALTATVTGTIPTGAGGFQGLSITPDASKLIVGSYEGNAVQVISLLTFVSTPVTTSLEPSSGSFNIIVATFVSMDGTQAYIVSAPGLVDVVDLTDASYPIARTLQFDSMTSGYGGGYSVCSSFDKSTLYMADYNSGSDDAVIARLDLSTGGSTSTTATIAESIGCNMTPDGKNVLFGAYGKDDPTTVYELDGSTLASVATYELAAGLDSDTIASSPKNCDVYVSNYYEVTNILNFTCNEPEAAALANTGQGASTFNTPLALGAGMLLAGVFALALLRRRSSAK